MKNERWKKELLPIMALLLFIIVVLAACAVSAGRKREETRADAAVETQEAPREEDALETEGAGKEKDTLEIRETIGITEEIPATVSGNQGEAAGETVEKNGSDGAAPSDLSAAASPREGNPVSGNDAQGVSANGLSVETVKKTNVEMLAEMMGYWERDNVAAVQDLSGLAHYRAMSASLKEPGTFYYYGERNAQERPDGTGIAVYGGDRYYYGSWEDGMREGEGMWLKMYHAGSIVPAGVNTLLNPPAQQGTASVLSEGQKRETAPDPALICHSYRGSWRAGLPDGEGHEQFEIDRKKAAEGYRYFQNVIGTFRNGLYDGQMYIVTMDQDGNTQEWKGTASRGTFETYQGRDQEGRVPICRNVQDEDSHLWIRPLENKDLGIAELE